MSKYNHPLLQEVDFSQAKEPAMEMLLALHQQQNSLDLNAYLTKPFETPLFSWVDAIQLDEENEQFEFIYGPGRETRRVRLNLTVPRKRLDRAPGLTAFVITMADSTSGLVGGYYLDRAFGYDLVFDRLLWDELGQPLDGRGFRLEYAGDDWLPVVVGKVGGFVMDLNRGTKLHRMFPYFPDQQVAKKLSADFSLKTISPQKCQKISFFALQVVEAVRTQPGWEKFSFAQWEKAQADMKQQLEDGQPGTLQALRGVIPLQAAGWLDEDGDLLLTMQIPGQGLACSLDFDRILYGGDSRQYTQARQTLTNEIICKCFGLRSTRNVKRINELSSWYDVVNLCLWRQLNAAWLGGEYSKVAQMLVDHLIWPLELDPYGKLAPNAHLLRDAEIGQWLPADFQITNQNKEGFRAFLIGVLNDLRDLTAEQTAKFFQQCLCSPKAQQVEFEKIDGNIQLLDLMEDGYFGHGHLSWHHQGNAAINHAVYYYCPFDPWSRWSSDPLPFSWKEQVMLAGFVFRLPQSEEDWAKTGQYCGMDEPEVFPLASGRIPPVIVSLADSPRVPIGVVEPLSADFELSEEFYLTLNEPQKQFDERFRQIVEQYWDIFDKKYPYLY